MRKFSKIAAVFALCFIMMLPVHAKTGDIAGRIYATDITATVNGHQVDSYNIGGKTAIILEDLQEIGAYAVYNEKLRTLVVSTATICDAEKTEADKIGENVSVYPVGTPVGRIFESDIVTYLNGTPVKTWCLNGKMAAAVEDIGAPHQGSIYSQYNAVCEWDEQKRTISLDFLTPSYSQTQTEIRSQLTAALNGKNAKMVLYGNRLVLEKSVVPMGGSMVSVGELDGDLPVDIVMEHGGASVVVGKMFSTPQCGIHIDDNGTATLVRDGKYVETKLDYAEILRIVNEISAFTATREEVVGYFTGSAFFATVVSRIDLDECTFLYLRQPTPHGSNHLLLRIAADGTYRNYADDFESVSLWGTKSFDDVTVNADSKTVTFGYDKWYKLDLVTGNLTELAQKPESKKKQ